MDISINAGNFAMKLDQYANITELSRLGRSFQPIGGCTFFEIGEDAVEWEMSRHLQSGAAFSPVPVDEQRQVLIRSMEKLPLLTGDWRMTCTGGANEIVYQVQRVDEAEDKLVSMTFSVPDTAVIHLAEHSYTGHRLDADMALEHVYKCGLSMNFMVIEMDGLCILLRTKDEFLGRARASIRRHDDTFAVTFSWHSDQCAYLALFGSLEEAKSSFVEWLEHDKGLRKLKDRPDVPDWLQDIELVIPVDMIRSNWEILCTYEDVTRMGADLSQYIEPSHVLLNFTGWCGCFDGCQPAYEPAPELGGEEGMRNMIDSLHRMGYKIMLHTTVWGIDPYVDEVEEWEAMSVTKNGKLTAWQVCRERPDRMVPFHYRTARIPLKPFAGKKTFEIPVGHIGGDCYAYFTLGGIGKGNGRVRLCHDRYPVLSPTGYFLEHELYDYIYPVYYKKGEATIEVQLSDDAELNLENAWLQIRTTTTYANPCATWSRPMLKGSPSHGAYNDIISKKIRDLTITYQLDAVYMDAACFYGEKDGFKETILAIKDSLPDKTVFQCEFLQTWEEFDFWMMCMANGMPDLLASQFPAICTREHGGAPTLEGVREAYAWMNKVSPVCDFSKDYIRYWVPGNGFVPVGKPSDICPPRKLPYTDSEAMYLFRGAVRLGQISSFHLNYRDYGIDPLAVKALRELKEGAKESV